MGTIADKLAYTKQAREEIQSAIVAKGVSCPSSAPFCSFDDYIQQISGGGSTTVPPIYLYNQDGLILILDAIYNSFNKNGHAHIQSTNLWQDKSFLGHDGNIFNATWTENSLVFNGSTSYVDCGQLNTSYVTLECLAKCNTVISSGESNYIASNEQNGGYGIYQEDGKYSGSIYVNGSYHCVYGTAVIESQIVHLAITYDGITLKLYQDGVQVDAKNIEGIIGAPDNNTIFALGANPKGDMVNGEYLDGEIYSTRVYSRALTSEEIYNNYCLDRDRYITGAWEPPQDGPSQDEDALEYITENLVRRVDAKDIPMFGGMTTFTNTAVNHKDDALIFNGSTSWLNCGRCDLTQCTIEVLCTFHIANESTSESHYVAGNAQSGGYGICQQNKRHVTFFNIGGTWYSAYGGAVIPYKAVHLAATYDGNNLKFYENGQLVSTVSCPGSIKAPSSNTVLSIGSNPNGSEIGIQQLNGKVYAVRVYSRALTDEEIAHNYSVDRMRFTGEEFNSNIVTVYNGAYNDASPVPYTIDVDASISTIVLKSPGALGTSGLWMKGSILCEVSLDNTGTFTELFTDTASSEGVWGGSTNGEMTYDRKYSFEVPTYVHQLRLTFTTVYRVSCDVILKA